jgi:phosphoglycerate kinase
MVAGMQPGDIVLLENLRFHSEEEANDEQFARKLAALADVYVNDAFGAAHRAHASTAAVAHLLPSYAGFLMERELDALGRILTAPDHPFVVVTGGAKISGKIDILQHLLPITDCFLVGGGMANTLLMARGYRVGASLVEPEKLAVARSFLKAAEEAGKAVYLPVDVTIATELRPHAPTMTVPIRQVPNQWCIVDIGPRTIEQFRAVLQGARTVLWNGPMGVFEIEQFARGTEAMARILALSGAATIVAGGDTVAAVEHTGLAGHMTHVSSGGGACLEYLEGRTLPGVAVLQSG